MASFLILDTDGSNRVLLVNDCVGCHSATDGSIWKDPLTGAPIVNNSVAPSFGQDNQGLAGGNFHWLVAGDQSKGHNVLTLPNVTADTDSANGVYPPLGDFGYNGNTSCGCCHGVSGGQAWLADCTSCHVPKHHTDDHPAGHNNVVDASGGYYRFLGSQGTSKYVPAGAGDLNWHTNSGVKGIEDPDWEANPTSAVHNEYSGRPMDELSWGNATRGGYASLSRWCSGCHVNAHNVGGSGDLDGGTGTASPWFRHPTDFALPDDVTKEYQYYTTYNPQAPVARPDIDNCSGPSNEVTPGTDMVQCLSCHRPHGSPYADMLRWDYTGMLAGGGGDTGEGCFVCHTTKD